MIAAIAMCALSLGAVLELALAAAIRSRAGRRRNAPTTTVTDAVSSAVTGSVVDSATTTGAVKVAGS